MSHAAPAVPAPPSNEAIAPLNTRAAFGGSKSCWCESCDLSNHGISTHMSTCPICGDKRCPRAAHHDNPCRTTHAVALNPDEETMTTTGDTAETETAATMPAPEAREPWCPDVCPITGRPFFMWIEHHATGRQVPTYGGPFDSYTVPVRDADGDFVCERYDHDRGGWLVDEVENVGLRLVDDQREDLPYGTVAALRSSLDAIVAAASALQARLPAPDTTTLAAYCARDELTALRKAIAEAEEGVEACGG
jgi:hypothetical protein